MTTKGFRGAIGGWFLGLALVVGSVSIAHAATNPPPPFIDPQGRDVTSSYWHRFNSTDQPTLPPELEHIRNYHFLFVRGIMGDFVTFFGKLIMNHFGEFQYYDEEIKWLRSLGIEAEQLKLHTEASTKKNAKVIAKAVLRATKPVVLIGHSKGTTDILQFLLDRKDLRPRVAGFLTMEGAVQGTPVADYLLKIWVLHAIADVVLFFQGGSGQSLKDLSTTVRIPWATEHQTDFAQIAHEVPVLSFGSWKNPDPSGKEDSMFKLIRDVTLSNMGLENDGLIPRKAMIVPGSRFVMFEGLDHATPVSNNKFISLDRPRFFKALLGTLFEERP